MKKKFKKYVHCIFTKALKTASQTVLTLMATTLLSDPVNFQHLVHIFLLCAILSILNSFTNLPENI